VTLILLGFVLALAHFQRSTAVDLELATLTSGEQASSEVTILAVHADGRLLLDAQPVTLDQLETALKQAGSGALLVRSDRRTPFEMVAAVLDRAARAGRVQVALEGAAGN
jgi:biopolymer transport protein ExbD